MIITESIAKSDIRRRKNLRMITWHLKKSTTWTGHFFITDKGKEHDV